MKLRKREVIWLVALGALLLVVRGMDSRTASLRRNASRAAAPAAQDAVSSPVPVPVVPIASANGAAGAQLSTADLASLAWGPNPFRGGAVRDRDDDPAVAQPVTDDASITPAAPRVPRFQGLVTVKGRTLAALDGRFLAPGERIGEWQVQEIGSGSVTVRQVRTGKVCRLSRERTAFAP